MKIINLSKSMIALSILNIGFVQASESKLHEHNAEYCYTMDNYASNKGSVYYDPNYNNDVRTKFMDYCITTSTATVNESGLGNGDYYKHKWLFESSNYAKSEDNIVQFYSFIDHLFKSHFLDNKNIFTIWRQGNISPSTDFVASLDEINVDNIYLRELVLKEANNVWSLVLSQKIDPQWSKTEIYNNVISPMLNRKMVNTLQDSGFDISKYK